MTQRIKSILFSDPMIRALIDGRKSQTRRVLKPQPMRHHWQHFKSYSLNPKMIDTNKGPAVRFMHSFAEPKAENTELESAVLLPYAPGDLLWVRETWRLDHVGGGRGGGIVPFNAYELRRRATDDREYFEVSGEDDPHRRFASNGWRPSIFMPRWASRLTLDVTAVKVERVRDISEADAIAEGCGDFARSFPADDPIHEAQSRLCWPQRAFSLLWNSIHGPGAWDQNPWVVVVSFNVHKANVDAVLKQREAA